MTVPVFDRAEGVSMYTTINFKTKKALKEAVARGEKIGTFQPGGLFPPKRDGEIGLEGPHYPAPHTWYATATVDAEGVIVKVK
jgi:hypothetical protein